LFEHSPVVEQALDYCFKNIFLSTNAPPFWDRALAGQHKV
jgi:hypothetical protein